MCLIVNFQPKFNISRPLMDNFAKRNNDGFGMMWIQDNRLCHMKFGPDKMQDLYAMYESVKAYEGFLHLRMRTHGATNQDMAHPFNCGFGIYMMHNGVLDAKGEDLTKSDTWYFVNNVLSPLFKMSRNPHKLIRSMAFSDLIHKYLGFNNRVVIGDRGGWQIFNSNSWHVIDNIATEVKGMLVSNTYAWDTQFGKTYTYNLPSPPPARHWPKATNQNYGLIQDDDDEDADVFPSETAVTRRKRVASTQTANHVLYPAARKEEIEEFLKAHFFPMGRDFYADAYGKVYKKRKDHGVDRRSDLDDNEQFWNSFTNEQLELLGRWMADANDLEYDTLPVGKDTTNSPTATPRASQLVLNWQNKSADQIKEDLKQHPDQAAEAIVALTHEPIHQVQ